MRKSLITAALVGLALSTASSFASADTLFSTADFHNYEAGGYIIDSSNFVGTTFHLNAASDITGIGGFFSQYSNDNIFGAILASGAAWNTVSSTALAEVTFSGSGNDQTINLTGPVHLAAGDYQLVFGSGVFGATGDSALVDSQYTLGNPNILQSFNKGVTQTALSTQDVRITVLGTVAAVPEVESYAMLLAGLGMVGALVRRRRTA